MKKYLIRVVKYVVYFAVLLGIVTALMEMTKPEPFKAFSLEVVRLYLIMGIGFSIIFPLISFGKREIYLNRSFAEDRDQIEKIMDAIGFVKVSEDGSTLVYRYKSGIKKFFMLHEDAVTINSTDNPLVVTGPLKEIRRMQLMFEQYLEKSEE